MSERQTGALRAGWQQMVIWIVLVAAFVAAWLVVLVR